jgi:hypothetical protein
MTSMMSTILTLTGGAIFGLLGLLHALYTFLDLRQPRRLVPDNPDVIRAMAASGVRLSRGGTDMWRAWVGFNFSHSLGLLLFSGLAIVTGLNATPSRALLPVLATVGALYVVLAARYWFRIPVIGTAAGTACLMASWLVSSH